MTYEHRIAAFNDLVDLAAERIGGKALEASDEFFAAKENLLKEGRGVFIPDKYTEHGKWMDGWESRRKRIPGNDWCIIRLGLPGVVRGVDIDTNHFLGNHPAYASVDACLMEDGMSEQDLPESDIWKEVLSHVPIAPGAQNMFSIRSNKNWTHLRLNIYPDGGLARFRAYGMVKPNLLHGDSVNDVDIVALANGGHAVACSDMFFSPMTNLIMPGQARNMGDGWETRRRRGPGNDWVILRAARNGYVNSIELDTSHFKGNFPDYCTIDACLIDKKIDALNWPEVSWTRIVDKQYLKAHHQHIFTDEVLDKGPFSHFRLNIYPDGGVSRLRVKGKFLK